MLPATQDPYLQAMTPLRSKLGRALWSLTYRLLFRPSPRLLRRWRAFLLRMHGAQVGPHCYIYPRARIWAPWNLKCEDVVFIGDDAEIYNHAPVVLRSHSIVSQNAYLCTASHDFNDRRFPIVAAPIEIGAYAWICARAVVLPGVTVAEGAVLGLGAIATKALDAWGVYGGNPARRIGDRQWNEA